MQDLILPEWSEAWCAMYLPVHRSRSLTDLANQWINYITYLYPRQFINQGLSKRPEALSHRANAVLVILHFLQAVRQWIGVWIYISVGGKWDLFCLSLLIIYWRHHSVILCRAPVFLTGSKLLPLAMTARLHMGCTHPFSVFFFERCKVKQSIDVL